jgi:Tfp pilus assembly PilM family ATPase
MKHKSFFDFFPTPKFMDMPAPGLSLNDSGLRYIEFTPTSHGLSVSHYGKAVLPSGIIEAGIIKDGESLVHVLQNFRKSFNLKYIRTSLPEERAYLFNTKLPKVSEKELRTAVEFTIEENVPLSVSEVVFDYVVLPKKVGIVDEIEVSVSVVPESVVIEYLEIFQKAGFIPLHFDVESQAITKSLISKNDHGVSLIVNWDLSKVSLYISSFNSVHFTSTTPTSYRNNKTKLIGATDKEWLMSPDIISLKEEIKKVLLYWQTQADKTGEKVNPIEKIVLCGEGSGKKELMEELSRAFNIKAELGNVWANAFSFDDYIPEISVEDSLAYAGAVGLAIPQQMLDLNK